MSSNMTPQDRLVTTVRLRAPGVLDDVIKSEMFLVLKEFLTDSGAWRESIEFTIISGIEEYDIEPSDVFDVSRLFGVKDSSGNRVYSWFSYPKRVTIRGNYAPGVATAEVVAVPKIMDNNDYPRCPQWVYDKYENTILDGVLGRLMSQPAKPYSNERIGIYHMRRFRNGMAVATSDARRMHVDSAQAWRFPQSFSTIRGR